MNIRIRRWLVLAGLLALTAAYAQAPGEDPIAIASRAYQLQKAGDYAAAADAYSAFLKVRPNEAGARSNLGVVLTKLGRYEEAIREYEAAEKLLPGDPRVGMNLAFAYEKSGRLPEAKKKLETLRQAFPQEKQITLLLADACLQMGDNARVIDLVQPFEQQDPGDLAIAYLLGTALLRERRISEGQVLLDRILKNGDTPEARFLLGMQMFESGDYPAAVKQFAATAKANPQLPEFEAYYGQALLITGDPDSAMLAFRRELDQDANNYMSNLGLGQILTARKSFDQAEPFLRKALAARPESVDAALALGICLAGEEKLPEARTFLLVAIKSRPDSMEAHRHLAQVDTKLHLMEEANRERAAADHFRDLAEAKSSAPGPRPNELAPAFTLPEAGTGKNVSLADFRGKTPVVLIFGSYTCPNFRASAGALKTLHARYGAKVPFLLVYIREAHGDGDWQSTRNERENVSLLEAKSLSEKQEHAQLCSRSLHLPFPALLDGLDNKVENVYGAWPSRAFVIGRDGRVRYSTRLTELDFSSDDM